MIQVDPNKDRDAAKALLEKLPESEALVLDPANPKRGSKEIS